MAIRREWLDWRKPCLPAAAAWLIQRAISGSAPTLNGASGATKNSAAKHDLQAFAGVCDLRSTMCVLPSRRAGRLLLTEILQQCQAGALNLLPPQVLTPGPMVDRVLDLHAPVASESETIFAWMKALQKIEPQAIKPLLPIRPDPVDVLARRELAITIVSLHAELSGQRLTFASVADQAERLELLAEGQRWQALEKLHAAYQRELAGCDLIDPHRARLTALKEMLEHRSDLPIARSLHHQIASSLVLVGVVEMNAVQRALVAMFDERCTALIHVPESRADRFDELGCVIPEAWTDALIEIDDDQIHIADRPSDQAQQVIRALAELDGAYAAPQITIGLGDESLSGVIERHAEWAGLRARSAAGRPLRQAGAYRLLEVAAEWLDDRRFASFAALLRHPDFEAWLLQNTLSFSGNPKSKIQNPESTASDWLTLLDRYFCDHLQERITETWLGDRNRYQRLAEVHKAVARLLAPLAAQRPQPISKWGQPILDVLTNVYGNVGANDESASFQDALQACQVLRDVLAEFAAAPGSLQPSVAAADALRLLLRHASGMATVDELRSDQLEMLGWLELHLDPAPVVIVTGFNDGFIPQAAAGDPFLPDSLRAKLGLSTNGSRHARDAYWIEAIRASRRHLTIIAGRHSAQGDPLTPSRLLLACDSETLRRRVRVLCDERIDHVKLPPIGMDDRATAGIGSQFRVPDLPHPLPPLASMRVTDFRRYLECPYRFALERLLGLESITDEAVELNPLQFGSLIHDVLCQFGDDQSAAYCQDSGIIEKFLLDVLAKRTPGYFGRNPMPAVRVQLARAAQRLRSFAVFQAGHCQEGWRIAHCEYEFKQRVALDIPGQEPMLIHGKIDRIDRNERTGQWLIIDYKTGESGDSPHQSHHGVEKLSNTGDVPWHDLQLPLYHYMVKQAMTEIDGDIALGYISLPQQTDGVKLKLAAWTDDHLAHAIELARMIVRDIREGKFQMNALEDERFDQFARICHSRSFGAVPRAAGAPDGGEA